ncbi:MAG: hypothetical protein L6R28_20785 [Planctomycetes bacterium]|nr:hypothetical protein [Planctomycetota bacterium]
MGACYKCGEPFLEDGTVAADAVCGKCSSYVHVCANCAHFDEYSKQKCREAKAPYVHDRLGKNDCAYFKFLRRTTEADEKGKGKKGLSPRAEQKDREGKARDKLEELFRK